MATLIKGNAQDSRGKAGGCLLVPPHRGKGMLEGTIRAQQRGRGPQSHRAEGWTEHSVHSANKRSPIPSTTTRPRTESEQSHGSGMRHPTGDRLLKDPQHSVEFPANHL